MVPLTSSLYCPGVMSDSENVLVEVGAGYFIEQDVKKAMDYCDRKIKMLQDSGAKVGEIIQYKRGQQSRVTVEFQKKMATMQQSQAEAAQK